jgi:hypothetical protein
MEELTREELEFLVREQKAMIIIQDICFFILLVVFVVSMVSLIGNC